MVARRLHFSSAGARCRRSECAGFSPQHLGSRRRRRQEAPAGECPAAADAVFANRACPAIERKAPRLKTFQFMMLNLDTNDLGIDVGGGEPDISTLNDIFNQSLRDARLHSPLVKKGPAIGHQNSNNSIKSLNLLDVK